MTGGIQKWAVLSYVTLCIYFLAQPSPGKLTARADSLDKAFSSQSPAILNPSLADALQTPTAEVAHFLTATNARPSRLIFKALLRKANSHAGEDPEALAVLQAGVSSEEAIAYFDAVEKKVSENISRLSSPHVANLQSHAHSD